jgi:signal peptidase
MTRAGAGDEDVPGSEDDDVKDGGDDSRSASNRNSGTEQGTDTTSSADLPGQETRPEAPLEWARWGIQTENAAVVYLREVLSSVGLVLLVGLLLFAISGLWPPMVAVESGSMNPHMQRGDLVFVMEEQRFVPKAAYNDTGVVTFQTGQRVGYRTFQQPGDVIVYQPNGRTQTTPIIHRARFWVNESENWVANGKANPEYLGGAESCGQLSQCPAPHAGFITKGDANANYDQAGRGSARISAVVKPDWVVGTAEFRVPWLGRIRLWVSYT